MKKDFKLPASDVKHLDSLNLEWETVNDGGQWLIIRSWKVPLGYTEKQVDVALQIPASYPDTQIDMAYFYPPLVLESSKDIKATHCRASFNGCSWQRWSRHRTSANPWRPGIDCIATHIFQVEQWLAREIP